MGIFNNVEIRCYFSGSDSVSEVDLSGILSHKHKQLSFFVYFRRMSIISADFSLKITHMTNVKSPLIRKNRLPVIYHIHPVLASSALF